MTRLTAWLRALLGIPLLAGAMANARAETVVLPTFNVVATTPLRGGEIDVAALSRRRLADRRSGHSDLHDSTVTQTLARQAPGVTVGNVSGNDFQPDVRYRGFDATPVTGTPIGLAVYQNGVRINEAFGDTVNWDLIPENAIDKMTIVAGDPIYGLNALGGALNVTMKNGFTWQGFEADLRGGSFYRAQEEFQYGKQIGDWSVYMAGTQINDGGWRVDSASQLTNVYGDVGYRANGFESHLQLTAGSTQFGASVFTPIQQLQNNWSSVYTVPQTTYNQMAMLAWTGSYAYSNTLSFQGGLYFRAFNQAHVDGNSTNVYAMSALLVPQRQPGARHVGRDHPRHLAERDDRSRRDRPQLDAVALGRRQRAGGRHRQDLRPRQHFHRRRVARLRLDAISPATASSARSANRTTTSFPIIGFPYIIDEPDSFLAPVAVQREQHLYRPLRARHVQRRPIA